ncbi:hypothetical protein ACJZ2D_009217 [Fusarium nematophilum]
MTQPSQYDSDSERLPHGMVRIGYDADTQTYTFRDADGSYWEGGSGHRFGQLTRVSSAPSESQPSPASKRGDETGDADPEKTKGRFRLKPSKTFDDILQDSKDEKGYEQT